MVGDKLNQILITQALSPEEFAHEINVGKSAVYKLLRGDTKKITLAMAKKINASFSEYSIDFLMSLNDQDKKEVGESYFEKTHSDTKKPPSLETRVEDVIAEKVAELLKPFIQKKTEDLIYILMKMQVEMRKMEVRQQETLEKVTVLEERD